MCRASCVRWAIRHVAPGECCCCSDPTNETFCPLSDDHLVCGECRDKLVTTDDIQANAIAADRDMALRLAMEPITDWPTDTAVELTEDEEPITDGPTDTAVELTEDEEPDADEFPSIENIQAMIAAMEAIGMAPGDEVAPNTTAIEPTEDEEPDADEFPSLENIQAMIEAMEAVGVF